MSAKAAVRLAWALGVVCMALVGASLVLLAFDWRAITDPFTAQLPWFLNAVIVGVLGVLIATRRPFNVIGWLMIGIALGNAIYLPADFVAMRLLLSGASPSAGVVEWFAWVFTWSGGVGAFALMFLIYFFPDGRLPGPRWRWVTRFGVVLSVLLSIGSILDTGPASLSPRLPDVPSPIRLALLNGGTSAAGAPWVGVLVDGSLVFLLALAVSSVVVRFRRSTGVPRRQLTWFAYAAGSAVVITVAGFVLGAFDSAVGGDVAGFAFDVGIGVLVPATIGLAVMRYGLYDIDVVISRTLVYGSLAVFITGIYVGIAVGIGELVGSGGKPNLWLSILATAIVAVGFQPVRERVQRVANRLVYGRRATPYEVLSEFSSRVAESYAGEEVLSRMAEVLKEGTGAEAATVWLRSGSELRPAATHPPAANGLAPQPMANGAVPDLPGASRVVAVRHQDEVLGALSIVKRRGEQLTPLEQKLLDDLAHQAGLVLRNVGLTAQLQARLEELRLSRQRLVSAQDGERRRLERNLHDGAQQHLVALKVKLGLAEMLLARDTEKAKATLQQLKSDADEALETLRDLARGIYPPLLADKGLTAALESQARKATVAVAVEADGIGRYSQDIEATVYFCCLEALQNVQKSAQASQVTVRLREANGELHFEVQDDGRGFDPATVTRGAGLTNMEDRLDALGGALDLVSSPGHGTTLRGTVPAASAAEGSHAGHPQPTGAAA